MKGRRARHFFEVKFSMQEMQITMHLILRVIDNIIDIQKWPISRQRLRERCIEKKVKENLTSVSFAFTHTYTLEK